MKDTINEIIKEAIEELNTQLDSDEKVVFSPETRFIGGEACIDSMSFVTFISIIEELVEDKLGTHIQLVNEKAFSQRNSPFYSIETLSAYIEQLLQEVK